MTTSRHELEGRVAVVTGASRGIGLAIARRFAAAGAHVAVVARSLDASSTFPGTLAETVRLIEDAGGKALPIRADITLAEDRGRLVEEVLAELGADRRAGQQRGDGLVLTGRGPLRRGLRLHHGPVLPGAVRALPAGRPGDAGERRRLDSQHRLGHRASPRGAALHGIGAHPRPRAVRIDEGGAGPLHHGPRGRTARRRHRRELCGASLRRAHAERRGGRRALPRPARGKWSRWSSWPRPHWRSAREIRGR